MDDAKKHFKNKLITHFFQEDKNLSDVVSPQPYIKKKSKQMWLLRGNEPIEGYSRIFRGKLTSHEIEVVCGDLYRLLAGLHQPKYRLVYGYGEKKSTKVISKAVPSFTPLKRIKPHPRANDYLEKGLCQVLVASFFLQESDLSENNIGYGLDENNKLKIIKLDHELSLDTDKFAISEENIISFPFIKDNPPFCWPPTWPAFSKVMLALKDHEDFIRQKFKYFLKIVLLDKTVFYKIANDHVDDVKSKLVSNYLEERRLALGKLLQSIPEFGIFMQKEGAITFQEILREFEQFNKPYTAKIEKKPEYQMRLIDLDKVKESFRIFSEEKFIVTPKHRISEAEAKEQVLCMKNDILNTPWRISFFGGGKRIYAYEGQIIVPHGVREILRVITTAEKWEKKRGTVMPADFNNSMFAYRNALTEIKRLAKQFVERDHFTRYRETQSKYERYAK